MYDMRKVFLECVREMREAGIPIQNGKVSEIRTGKIEGNLIITAQGA